MLLTTATERIMVSNRDNVERVGGENISETREVEGVVETLENRTE